MKSDLFTEDNLPFDINEVKTPYDYMKFFIPDQLVDKIVEETKRYAAQENCPTFQAKVDRGIIRASHAIMVMSDYLSTVMRIFWEKKENTRNTLVKKAMPRNTFDDIMHYTHFADNHKPKDDDCFWKQFIRRKATCFGYKVWVLATSKGELILCEPYGGTKTKLFDYDLGQGPNVVYGLVEDAKLVAGSKVVCDNLFTSLDLLDNMSKKGIGVIGTMRQNKLCNISLPSKQQAKKMRRDQKE
ncbi:hypothetical protein O3P69_018089 [Scylla paramamosain]|uniref:PiggyBac transposable element-derived protein domain-containing protein n=1 Tax=Scylla paramamosain TaxID=85552 RepID=A0AAW0TIU0_SCYPA